MTGKEDRPPRVLALVVPAYDLVQADTNRASSERTSPEERLRLDRIWAETLSAVQRVVPGAKQLRPGCCIMLARGPARYYGGEDEAARMVLGQTLECVQSQSEVSQDLAVGVAVGIANGRFAAEQAALAHADLPKLLRPAPGIHRVDPHDTAEFLSVLPMSCAVDEPFAAVLRGLGIRTLGAFAELPEHSVQQRFGRNALLAHRRARGLGEAHGAEIIAGASLHDLSASFEFESPVEGVDQLAFACSGPAEQFVQRLAELLLVCTELRVELIDDESTSHERVWSHPANFTATDVVNRVRWQAAALPKDPGRGGAGIAAVRITPERTAAAATHEPGLWNDAPADRVHHQLTRVQSLLGPEGVGTGTIAGGRVSRDRQRLVPWGAKREPPSTADPWPGQLLGPLPNLLPDRPPQVKLIDVNGANVYIDDDELLSGDPLQFCTEQAPPHTVRSWSAPWPLRERWWDASAPGEPNYRMQMVLDDGSAWLLSYTVTAGWLVQGRYA